MVRDLLKKSVLTLAALWLVLTVVFWKVHMVPCESSAIADTR